MSNHEQTSVGAQIMAAESVGDELRRLRDQLAASQAELTAAREGAEHYFKRCVSAEERLLPCYQRKAQLLYENKQLNDQLVASHAEVERLTVAVMHAETCIEGNHHELTRLRDQLAASQAEVARLNRVLEQYEREMPGLERLRAELELAQKTIAEMKGFIVREVRVPGCQCTWEIGDSPCPEHPLNPATELPYTSREAGVLAAKLARVEALCDDIDAKFCLIDDNSVDEHRGKERLFLLLDDVRVALAEPETQEGGG